ncbi:MAG TPA: hypothetical protein VM764_04355 [Gemmatimonadaceae bacterium]|jgi:hypothetical protein|nr:hypothetical protein [Gemmatimonadaceae bacterium]
MATSNPQVTIPGLLAGADLSSKQYHQVKLDSNGKVVACSATTDVPIGVLQNAPDNTLEKAAVVACGGTTKLVAGGALATPGTALGTKNDGRAQAATSSQYSILRSIGTSGADGDIIEAVFIATARDAT